MTETIQFECRKIAYRQTKDGVVVSFLVNPHDVPDELATAELQTIYIARLQQTESGAWDEQASSDGASTPSSKSAAPQSGEETAALSSEPASTVTTPAVVVAAPQREEQLRQHASVAKSRKPFSEYKLSQQCAMRCGDREFQRYMHFENEAEAVDWVHTQLGGSRKILDSAPVRAEWWRMVEDGFKTWLLEEQHGSLIR